MRADELSFVLLTYNEAEHIEQALRSLPHGSPILVLDAQSTDSTVATARSLGAVVEIRGWTNFLEARAYMLTRVHTAWTFMLDADECLDHQLRDALLASDGRAYGYRCRRKNRFCGQVILGGTWGQEEILRCVRTDKATIQGRNGGTLHEELIVPGPTPLLAGAIDHFSYPNIASYRRKFARYTTIEAAEAGPSNGLEVVRCVPAAVARACWHFIGRGGWRDGWRGGFIAVASALYPVVVALKRLRHKR